MKFTNFSEHLLQKTSGERLSLLLTLVNLLSYNIDNLYYNLINYVINYKSKIIASVLSFLLISANLLSYNIDY